MNQKQLVAALDGNTDEHGVKFALLRWRVIARMLAAIAVKVR